MNILALCNQLNKSYIIIAVLVILIIILLILKHYRENKNYAHYYSRTLPNPKMLAENFDVSKLPKDKHITISLYYTEWCGHSQKFLPVWTQFENYITENKLGDNIKLEKVDCDKEKEKCTAVSGYPTIVLSKDPSNKIEMDGKYARTLNGLIEFLTKNL
jgi:thiol-disulfide isomerase/thioredoxin